MKHQSQKTMMTRRLKTFEYVASWKRALKLKDKKPNKRKKKKLNKKYKTHNIHKRLQKNKKKLITTNTTLKKW